MARGAAHRVGTEGDEVLRYRLIHPEVLAALAAAGHGSRVLIADGHYPVSTGVAPSATRVFLNLAPDVPSTPEVLEVLLDAIVVESATLMQPPASDPEPPIFEEIEALLVEPTQRLDRFAFYAAARSEDVALVIATGERRIYANVLLTLGVV